VAGKLRKVGGEREIESLYCGRTQLGQTQPAKPVSFPEVCFETLSSVALATALIP